MMAVRLLLFILALTVSAISYANNQILGLLVGVILLILAFRGLSDASVPMSETQTLTQWLRAHGLLSIVVLATLGSMIAAVIASRDQWSLIANYLWLVSVLLIMFAALHHDRVGLTQLRALWTNVRRREVVMELALLAFITSVALILRVYDLEQYPLSMHGDEGEIGLLALRVVEGKEPIQLWGTLWSDLPTMLYYFKAVSLIIFGKSEIGLRMTSALFGAAAVPLLYWLGRIAWGRLAAFTAAWLMTVSHLAIHYSRSGLNIMEGAFGMIAVMLMLALARERAIADSPDVPRPNRELSLYVGIGLVMALMQYIYYGARLIPIVVAPLLFYLWLENRVHPRQVLMITLAGFIMFAPMALFYMNHPGFFVSRMDQVNIFSDANVRHTLGQNASLPSDLIGLVQNQLEGTLGFIMGHGDRSGFYFADVPNFDSVTAMLAWLGLGVTLTRARRFYEFALLLWFGLGLFLGGFMTLDPPSAQRLIIVVPSIFLLGGVFVARTSQFIVAAFHVHPARLGAIALALAGLLVLAINAQIYLVDYMRRAPNLAPIMVAREMQVTPESYHIYFMGAPIMYADYATIRFIARGAHPQDLSNTADLPPPSPEMGILVLALPNHLAELKMIEDRFPGGVISSYTDPVGRLVYTAYRIPPTDRQ